MLTMKEFQAKNCTECRFRDARYVGTGEPCCTYWTRIEVEGDKCLSGKPGPASIQASNKSAQPA